MSSIFDKYTPTKVKEIKKLSEEDDKKSNSGRRADRLELEVGQNKVRIWPKHPSEKNWMFMFCMVWLGFEKDDGSVGRRTIPNARIHGGLKQSPTEAYIALTKEKYGTSDDTADAEKIKAVTDWKQGLNMSTTWGVYASHVTKEGHGPVQLWEFYKAVRDDLNNAMQVEEEDEEIATDPFTHPIDGRYLLVTVKKVKTKTHTSITLSDKKCPLSEEDLEAFERLTPLSKLPAANYIMRDFENEIEGLRLFDEEHDMDIFDSDEFKDACKKIKKELVARGTGSNGKVNTVEDDDNDDDNDDLPFIEDKKSTKAAAKPQAKKAAAKKQVVEEEEDDDDEPETEEEENAEEDAFAAMDRNELKQYFANNDLKEKFGIKLLKSDSDEEIRDKIRAVTDADETATDDDEPEEEDEEVVVKPAKKAAASVSKASTTKTGNRPTMEQIKAKLAEKGKK